MFAKNPNINVTTQSCSIPFLLPASFSAMSTSVHGSVHRATLSETSTTTEGCPIKRGCDRGDRTGRYGVRWNGFGNIVKWDINNFPNRFGDIHGSKSETGLRLSPPFLFVISRNDSSFSYKTDKIHQMTITSHILTKDKIVRTSYVYDGDLTLPSLSSIMMGTWITPIKYFILQICRTLIQLLMGKVFW